MRSRGTRTIAQVATDLGVGPNQLHKWAEQLDKFDFSKRNDKGETLEEENRRLRKENERLQLEKTILKKAALDSRVARLMQEAGLLEKTAKKFKITTDSRHDLPTSPNLLERNFRAPAPNRVWVSDITYIWTREGWLYLAVIIDLYSRKVVGWCLRDRMTTSLVCDALETAVRRRRPAGGLIFHSDRGSQYASAAFRKLLKRFGMLQSMSRKGNCWDNAVAESFFATLKKELVRDLVWPTKDWARAEVFEYIEAFYNRKRGHVVLGYVSPNAFESCDKPRFAA